MKIVIKIFFLLIYPHVNALECQWWQAKVRTHQVNQHQRRGTTVSVHDRQEHCREKWKGADALITHFNINPI
jgi:hypothetical protein